MSSATKNESPLPRATSVVIVTYQSADHIGPCLDALHPTSEAAAALDVVVVDNNSPDDTRDRVTRRGGAELLALSENNGFAAGVNAGVARTTSRYVLLLNPDARVTPEGVAALEQYMEAHPRVAAVGPAQRAPSGEMKRGAQALPTLGRTFARRFWPLARRLGAVDAGFIESDAACAVGWISGACFLLRRETWDEIGSLDTRYFLYYEEIDWCHRAAKAGWSIHHVPSVCCEHVEGASVKRSAGKDATRFRNRHLRRSRRRYFRKHHGLLSLWGTECVLGAAHVSDHLRRAR